MSYERRRRFGVLVLIGLVLLVPAGSVAQGVSVGQTEGFRVVSAGRILVGGGPEATGLRIGGVWTPSPPRGRWPGDYRGDDARQRVQALLETGNATVLRRWSPRGKGEPFVRLSVPVPNPWDAARPSGQEAELRVHRVDLAVLLALEGLALCDRTTASDRLHADAVCAAEREARRQRRGLHDGGFLDARSRYHDVIEIGELAETPSSPGEESAAPGWWAADDSSWILSSPEPLDRLEKIPAVQRRSKGESHSKPD